ncbi:methyltransferase domain-containing protein [Granulicella sp. 5B5]|uniref:class I SAM-dependent methyltransferase n=1 Tax=Granulicella sp. 5B5 TaxID=1617967 RepID=UPI0015F507F5|nr:class I SAM-dependent methyltransferase [Granulicella sp. 5B5]QMV17999.1 methyltransferase domain-containing protein [Granulicella sp. 5B5]
MEPLVNPGARPANELSESEASEHVRSIFNSIAPSYDLLNHLLSMGLDRRWWSRTARTFRTTLARPDSRILDLCCGTGDMTAALLKLRPHPSTSHPSTHQRSVISTGAQRSGETCVSDHHELKPTAITPITGLDFSPEMLTRARLKYPSPNVIWTEGDAMHLPYPDNSFDLVTAAFGFRNLPNYAAGLREIHRVLRPGGQLGILECNQPDGLRGLGYSLYFHHVLPLIGGLISGDRSAYKYLPDSVMRFPRPPQMLAMLHDTGFTTARWDGYFLKAAGLYVATKP